MVHMMDQMGESLSHVAGRDLLSDGINVRPLNNVRNAI